MQISTELEKIFYSLSAGDSQFSEALRQCTLASNVCGVLIGRTLVPNCASSVATYDEMHASLIWPVRA